MKNLQQAQAAPTAIPLSLPPASAHLTQAEKKVAEAVAWWAKGSKRRGQEQVKADKAVKELGGGEASLNVALALVATNLKAGPAESSMADNSTRVTVDNI